VKLLALCAALLVALGCHPGASRAQPDGGGDGGTTDQGDGGPGGPDGGFPDAGPPQVHVRAIFPGIGSTKGFGTAMVTGSGFVDGFAARGGADVNAVTSLSIGGAAALSVDVIDDNRVELTLPAGTAGPADVVLANPNGTSTCLGCFRYLTPISIDSIAPAAGSTQGGFPVTIKGHGFVAGMLVTVGEEELIGRAVVDEATITGIAPPGLAGAANVRAVTADGRGELRSGFIYGDPLRVDSVAPHVASIAGGTRLVVSGRGFSPQASVLLDGAPVATSWAGPAALEATAAAHAAGAVDLAVSDPGAVPALAPSDALLQRGLLYADLSAPAPAPLALTALTPAHGPLAGGTCPAACLTLLGAGFTQADLLVFVGGAQVAQAGIHLLGDHALSLDLPFGAAAGPVDVEVRSATQAAAAKIAAGDARAFRYDPPFFLTALAPAQGPASGAPATAVVLSGSGFLLGPLQLFIGALPATGLQVAADGRSLGATAPQGTPGPADVVVSYSDAQGTRHEARLPGGFAFTAPLVLQGISPTLGAQAGGTRVELFGSAFSSGLSAAIGASPLANLELLSPTHARGLAPPGPLGAAAVSVALASQGSSIVRGYTYFDPGSRLGGGTGGPILGTLNITALDDSAYKKGGVAGASVSVTFPTLPASQGLAGLTDANGQITFSDDRLVLPVEVTATKASYSAVTVFAVQTANLSIYLGGPAGPPPPPPPNPPPPPPPPLPAAIGGHVYGFKLPPGTVLTSTQRTVARVSIARPDIYSLPPFAPEVPYQTVPIDGGGFRFDKLYSLNPTTLYGVFGIEDSSSTPPRFTPILLGVRRAVQPDPAQEVTSADLIFDTHLDQSIDATIVDPPSSMVGHDAFVDLDLGAAGAIPLDHVLEGSDAYHLHFQHLPSAAGQGFVFVDQTGAWTGAAIAPPVSTYLRRVFGDLSGVVSLGPLLPFPVISAPLSSGAFDGTFSWTTSAGLSANLQQLYVEDATAAGDQHWEVILPGDTRSLQMPMNLRARLAPGAHGFSITTSLAPNFDFGHWNYADLCASCGIAYAYDNGQFLAPAGGP